MINSARVGTSRVGFNRRPVGERSSQVEDFINTAAAMAELNSNLAELALAISSRRFSAVGSDLIHEVKIEPWRAVLGSELVVPTLEGNVRLKIPPGTQGGQRFRLRERGLPGVSGKRGDLYVDVQINVPKKLTDREREIWRELAKLHGG